MRWLYKNLVVLPISCLFYYVADWFMFGGRGNIVFERSTEHGTYIFANGKLAKDAIKQVKEQMREQKIAFSNARFGGIYVKDKAVAREIHDAMNKAGLPVACRVQRGPLTGVTLIDT